MNVFNALWDNPEQVVRPPGDGFELVSMQDWLSESSTHKILSGTFQCPLPEYIEASQKPAQPGKPKSSQNKNVGCHQPQKGPGSSVSNQKAVYIPGLVKLPELCLNRMSALSDEEHENCLNLLMKFDGKSLEDLTPVEKVDYQLFQSLYKRVKQEQKEYLEYAERNWPEFVGRATEMRGDPHNYFINHWNDRVYHVMAQYPNKKFKKLRVLSLNHKQQILVKMRLLKNVLNIGKVPVAKLPEFKSPFRIASGMIRLKSWGFLNVPAPILSGTLHRVPVSRDPNAERLARLHGANVVISSSAFKCFVDNHEKINPHSSGISRSWLIPVTVREHRSFCNGKPVTKTIVFIDKALPNPKVSPYEKVCWYQKQALFAAIVHRHFPGGIAFEVQGRDIMTRRDVADNTLPNTEFQRAHENSTQEEMVNSCDDSTKEGSESSPVPETSTNQEEIVNSCDDSTKEGSESLPIPETSTNQEEIVNSGDDSTKEGSESSPIPETSTNPSQLSDILHVTTSKSNDSDGEDDDSADESALVIALPDDENETSLKLNTSKALPSEIDAIDLAHADERVVENISDVPNSGNNGKGEETGINISGSSAKGEETGSSTASVTTVMESEIKVPSKPAPSHKWEKVPAPGPVEVEDGSARPISTTNVTYNMWSLQSINRTDDSACRQSECEGSINLLIRSHIDACETLGSGTYQPLSLASKPEFQLEYGAGVVPLSDLSRQWAKLLIQPDSVLARVRVDVKTGELVKVEKRTLADVEHEAQVVHNQNLNDTLPGLFGVLSNLTKLQCGQYLLSHQPDMGLEVELYSTAHEGEAAEKCLLQEYGNRPTEIVCEVPWQRLDPTTILPKHLNFKQMPCTFPSRKTALIHPKICRIKEKPQFVTVKRNSKKNNKKKNREKKKLANAPCKNE